MRKEKRKMLGGGGGGGGGGGVPDIQNINTNFGTKKKHGNKNLKSKLNKFVSSLTNSKLKGKKNKRKEFEMTEKKWKNHSDSKEGKPSPVKDRIELRKAKRNQLRRNKAGSKKKFPQSSKDFRKQKRKQNRQENKEFSKLSQSQTQTYRNQHQRQMTDLTDYPQVRNVMVLEYCDGVMVLF